MRGSPGNRTLNLRIKRGAVSTSQPLPKFCIVAGQKNDLDSRMLSLFFVVLRRARVEIVSRVLGRYGRTRRPGW
jgi:hypothetical protein